MPKMEKAFRKQKALLWLVQSYNEYYEPIFDNDNPEEIEVRWNYTDSEGMDSEGNKIRIDGYVVADREIPIDSVLLLASLDELPSILSGTGYIEYMQVVNRKITKDIKGRNTRYTLSLIRYKGSLDVEILEIPQTISGLWLWLEANRGTYQNTDQTIQASNNGDIVAYWQDQSGFNRDMIQSIIARRPIKRLNILNGRPSIRFDGVDDFLESVSNRILSQPLTLFVIGRKVVDTGVPTFFLVTTSNQNAFGIDSSNRTFMYGTQGFESANVTSQLGDKAVFKIHYGLANGASSNIRVNQLSYNGNSTFQLANNLFIGKNDLGSFSDTEVLEILIYNKQLSTEERGILFTYLSEKYGITL